MSAALYYALGGGLGHITRARAVLHQWGVKARVLTRAEFVGHPVISAGLDLLPVPEELAADVSALDAWLEDLLQRLQPSVIYLDSFPLGLFGEFGRIKPPQGVHLQYIARLLRWQAYQQQMSDRSPFFQHTHVLEPLAAEHADWVQRHSRKISPLTLVDEPMIMEDAAREAFLALREPRWLVVHAGGEAEIEQLLHYAEDQANMEGIRPSLCLVSPRPPACLPEGVLPLKSYPALPLYPLADRIISACGFNTMRQTLDFKGRHRFLPMPRRFDDQFARAAERRKLLQKE